MTLGKVKAALRKAGIAFVDASSADWIDDAVWVGGMTLVGVSDDTITVLTRSPDDDDADVDVETWDSPDESFILTLRGRLLRDEIAVALANDIIAESDLAWVRETAAKLRRNMRESGFALPSGRVP